MSSRALRHLSGMGKGSKPIDNELHEQEESSDEEIVAASPRKPFNAFAALGGCDDDNDTVASDNAATDGQQEKAPPISPSKTSKNKKKKKKKKKGGDVCTDGAIPNKSASSAAAASAGVTAADGDEIDEVERCVQEVNSLLGVTSSSGAAASSATAASLPSLDTRGLLCVDYRNLNADNEMKKIFGAKVVKSANRHQRGGRHDARLTRKAGIITPQDTWPQFGRSGLSMNLVEHKGSYYHFAFEHSEHYRQTQISFWESVETMNPDAIAAVLREHPYHVDSLLQLAEICKMNEDRRAAAELIERALFALEGGFHTLFNVATGCNRLDYKKMENRSFFLAVFRHLVMVGLRGCYRTSLEYCKLLLSLDPDSDPLGVLLILDFYALRGGEYQFLIRLANEWEAHHHLSRLPNMAFSCALARFHGSGASGNGGESVNTLLLADADKALQTALLQFPMVLVPLLDKCGVVMDTVANHSFFSRAGLTCPDPLERVCKLYIERAHSVWKEPEVLTWLEKVAIQTLKTVDGGDKRVATYKNQRTQLYQKTPRNVLRHIMVSDLPNVSAYLPPDAASESIMAYDPLPPADSHASYSRPERRTVAGSINSANWLTAFLQSISPNFDPDALVPEGGDQAQAQPRIALNADGLQTMADLVTQAARDGHAGVANALHQLLNALQIQGGPEDGAGQQVAGDNAAGGGGGDAGEDEDADENLDAGVAPGFNPGDYIHDDDFEFD